VARCLSQHRAELSPQCRKNISKGAKRAGKLAQACKSDSEKLCSQVKSGDGRQLRCLASNKAQLSDQCRQKVEEVEKRHPCLGDINRLCADVQPGKGRMDQCLRQHRAELTAQCGAALDKAPKRKK
jgi:Cysteine rich repeat